MWVKICANTNIEDALAAAEAGADAVGFVFAPSVRQVTQAVVREITSALPASVERVGVFGSGAAEEILEAVDVAGLTAAQLHGGLDLRLAETLRARGVAVIHTLHWVVGEDSGARVGASGVEAGPGRKDAAKVRAFIENARRAWAHPG